MESKKPADSISITSLSPDISSAQTESSTTNEIVVFVEDDKWVLNAMVRSLAYHGLNVCGYADPFDALELLKDPTLKFAVLVTDYNMPILSGLEFSRRVRQIHPDLPIIVTSGYIDEKLRSQMIEAGASALVSKPFASQSLCDLIKQLSASKATSNPTRDG